MCHMSQGIGISRLWWHLVEIIVGHYIVHRPRSSDNECWENNRAKLWKVQTSLSVPRRAPQVPSVHERWRHREQQQHLTLVLSLHHNNNRNTISWSRCWELPSSSSAAWPCPPSTSATPPPPVSGAQQMEFCNCIVVDKYEKNDNDNYNCNDDK